MTISSFFSQLERQYNDIITHHRRPYLTLSSKGEPSFKSYINCIHFIMMQLLGDSLDLAKAAATIQSETSKLVHQIEACLQRKSASDQEIATLKTALKMEAKIHDLLNHAIERRTQKKRSISSLLEKMEPQVDLIMRMITCIATHENTPVVEIALRYNLPKIAYSLIETGESFSDIPNEELQKLIPYCIAERNQHLLVQLIGLGVHIDQHKDSIHIPSLAWNALDQHNEQALLALIDQGLPLSTKNEDGIPLIALVVHNGMNACLKKMIEKGASCRDVDQRGNTALHYAFYSRNKNACIQLFPYVDPAVKNSCRHTALEQFPP